MTELLRSLMDHDSLSLSCRKPVAELIDCNFAHLLINSLRHHAMLVIESPEVAAHMPTHV